MASDEEMPDTREHKAHVAHRAHKAHAVQLALLKLRVSALELNIGRWKQRLAVMVFHAAPQNPTMQTQNQTVLSNRRPAAGGVSFHPRSPFEGMGGTASAMQ